MAGVSAANKYADCCATALQQFIRFLPMMLATYSHHWCSVSQGLGLAKANNAVFYCIVRSLKACNFSFRPTEAPLSGSWLKAPFSVAFSILWL